MKTTPHPALCAALLAACALTSRASAQNASFSTFGATCNTTVRPVPSMIGVAPPRLGSTFVLRTTGSWWVSGASGLSIVTFGASRTQWGSVALPFDLGRLSAVGIRYHCSLLVSPDLSLPLPWTQGSPRPYDVRVAIPNQSALLGLRFYVQTHMFHQSIGETDVNSSIGGAGVVGR